MNNADKTALANFVISKKRLGRNKKQTVDEIAPLGFKRSTVAKYYEVFSK